MSSAWSECAPLREFVSWPPPVPFAYLLGPQKTATTDVYAELVRVHGGEELVAPLFKEPHGAFACSCESRGSVDKMEEELDANSMGRWLGDVIRERWDVEGGVSLEDLRDKGSRLLMPGARRDRRVLECGRRTLSSVYGLWDVKGGKKNQDRFFERGGKRWPVTLDASATSFELYGADVLAASLGPPARGVYLFRAPGARILSEAAMFVRRFLKYESRDWTPKAHSVGAEMAEIVEKQAKVFMDAREKLLIEGLEVLDRKAKTALDDFLEMFAEVYNQAAKASGIDVCERVEIDPENGKEHWPTRSHLVGRSVYLAHHLRWLRVLPPQHILAVQTEAYSTNRLESFNTLEQFLCLDKSRRLAHPSNTSITNKGWLEFHQGKAWIDIEEEDEKDVFSGELLPKNTPTKSPQRPLSQSEEWVPNLIRAAANAELALASLGVLHLRFLHEFDLPSVVIHESPVEAWNRVATPFPSWAFDASASIDPDAQLWHVQCTSVTHCSAVPQELSS